MKIIFLVWLVYNPNHTVTLSYMGGHEYASAATCNAISVRANDAVDITEQEFACTSNLPASSARVMTMDKEALWDDEEFFIKMQ